MLCEAAVYSSKLPPTMAAPHSARMHGSTSLDLMCEVDGRSVLARQGSLPPSSPQLDRRARPANSSNAGGSQGSTTIRRSLSVGSGLSAFLGNSSSRKALEGDSLRRSGGRGCLDSLESGSNLKAMLDEMGDEDFCERLEEEIDWGFKAMESPLRGMHREPFPSTHFRAHAWQSFGKGGLTPHASLWDPAPVTSDDSANPRVTTYPNERVTDKRSVVMDQAQGAFDTMKDRLEFSLKMQPECSYSPAGPALGRAVSENCIVDADSNKRERLIHGLGKEVGCLSLPTSLRSLKRRNSHSKKLGAPEPCAVLNAFSSMVYIIKAIHGHASNSQQACYTDQVRRLVTPVHREMELSFVWLFQQVFACTPGFMLSLMVLLSNFTVHALGENVALAAAVAMATSTPEENPQTVKLSGLVCSARTAESDSLARKSDSSLEAGVNPQVGFNQAATDAARNLSIRNGKLDRQIPTAEDMVLKAFMEDSMKEMESLGWRQPVQLEPEVLKKLVAPVHVTLAPDNYPCFDRTDLEYQHGISLQPNNVMLLANYAQFLYMVRHDNNRAEDYFHRAMQVDPSDGEVLGRYANFLWIARGDRDAAERAFRAAAASDPANAFHAGNYSHFMWHAEDVKEQWCSVIRTTGTV